MYCKKCGKDYPKTKKICKECGIALTPGTSPGKKGKSNKKFIFTGIAVFVVIIAVFLIIGLGGMIPQKLQGFWSFYDQSGISSSLEFTSSNTVKWTKTIIPQNGTYSYNSETGEGNIYIEQNGNTYSFTCDGTILKIEGTTYTK